MTARGTFGRRAVEVPCTVEIERTAESFHAHAVPEGIELRPGDEVLVHGAPARVGFGERVLLHSRATVLRAGPLRRLWTRAAAFAELTELYEVGFSPGRHP